MKVGILTFHETYNPGAYLQALATLKLLERMGHEGRLIHYTSPDHRFAPWRRLVKKPHSVVLAFRGWLDSFRRHAAFARRLDMLKPTRRFETRAQVADEHFDAVVIGADIVWNYRAHFMGGETIYFGHGLNADRLIAFAPSCGSLKIEDPAPDFVREGLAKFHALSARDEHTADLAEAACGTRPPVLMDPTLGLHLDDCPSVPNRVKGDYLLVYAIPGFLTAGAIEQIRAYARKETLRTVAACYRHPWADRNLVDAGPFEWVQLIRNARAVATNTFHGTIFSIKCGANFVTEYNVPIRTKTEPMLERLGMTDRVFSTDRSFEAIWSRPWPVEQVHERMGALADESEAYLRDALESDR